MPEKEHVALTKCFYCGESDKILLATHYNNEGEPLRDLAPAHGKIIDMDPCTKCAEYMEQGIILLGIDDAKSEPNWHLPPGLRENNRNEINWIPNPWRSGAFVVIREEAFTRLITDENMQKFGLERRFMFIEHEALERMGALDCSTTEEAP